MCVDNTELPIVFVIIKLHFKGFLSVVGTNQQDKSLKRSVNFIQVRTRTYGLNLVQYVSTGYIYRE